MALNLANQYPGKTIPATAAYPYGSGRNVTVQGDGSGTPYEQAWFNDLQGFLQAVLQAGSVVPSGTPDSAVVSDYLTALRALFLNTGNLGTDDGDIPQIGTPGVDAAGDRSAVVVRSGSNANGSYRVWSDGFRSQWQFFDMPTNTGNDLQSWTFPIAFTTLNTLTLNGQAQAPSSTAASLIGTAIINLTISSTDCRITRNNASHPFNGLFISANGY